MDKEKIWEEILANPHYSRTKKNSTQNIGSGKTQASQEETSIQKK